MDIKAKINEIADKIKNDPDLMARFQSDPVGAVESLAGVDLPNEQIQPIVDAIKAKLDVQAHRRAGRPVRQKIKGYTGLLLTQQPRQTVETVLPPQVMGLSTR
ncbi:MAG: hypothetical protein IIV61_08145 [Oscillospiraceae bacterium]|nr:hypothetical protein [Oscillospiraceae bacterium]